MAATKAKELDNRKDGDRGACAICVPVQRRGRVPAWKVWAWSLAHPGENPLRNAR